MKVKNSITKLIISLGLDPDELKFNEVDKQGTLNILFMGISSDMKTPTVENFNNVLGRNVLEINDTYNNLKVCIFIKEEELLSFENYIETSKMSSEDLDKFIEDDDFQKSIGLVLNIYIIQFDNFKEL